jgi:hypothetical protein
MSRVNFRTIRERFKHIDAEFVSCELGFGGAEPHYTVRFYPWWEHPVVAEAVRTGRSWGARDGNALAKEVTVYPIGLAECRLSRRSEVRDWAFHESHPLLWPYEDCGEIFCNSSLAPDDLYRRVHARLQNVDKEELCSYLDPLLPHKAPFCLGNFPFTLFNVVQEELADMGVKTFIPGKPEPRPAPVLLLIDNSDYIIADDFELDIPEWEHDPEAVQP